MSHRGDSDKTPDSSEQMATGAKSHGEPRPGSKRPRDERSGHAGASAKDEPPRIQCSARVMVDKSDTSGEQGAKIRRRGGNRSDESGSASSSSSTTFSAPDDELVGATEVQAGKVFGKWQKEGRSTNNYRLKKISRW